MMRIAAKTFNGLIKASKRQALTTASHVTDSSMNAPNLSEQLSAMHHALSDQHSLHGASSFNASPLSRSRNQSSFSEQSAKKAKRVEEGNYSPLVIEKKYWLSASGHKQLNQWASAPAETGEQRALAQQRILACVDQMSRYQYPGVLDLRGLGLKSLPSAVMGLRLSELQY